MLLEVVICTHNPNQTFLAKTVEGLKSQILPTTEWGFILVDNASDPALESSWVDWHPNGRVIVQEKLGLSNARICGIENSDTPWILFVDDDNVLANDYLDEVLRIAREFPHLGAFGANKILPEYDVEPEAECKKYVRALALRNGDGSLWSNDPRDGLDPWGAGLVVNRPVAQQFVEAIEGDPIRQKFGRKGNSLNSAEDREFTWIACANGYSKGIFSSLRMKHLIDARRVSKDYLVRILEGHSFSHTLMRYVHRDKYASLSDQLKSTVPPSIPTKPGLSQRLKYYYCKLLSLLPGKERQLKNRIRVASLDGVERARKLIEEIHQPTDSQRDG